MSLVTLQDAELAYGLHPLLDRANLTVLDGERIGLIGRNGTVHAGKESETDRNDEFHLFSPNACHCAAQRPR